jgi:hypothetical protein
MNTIGRKIAKCKELKNIDVKLKIKFQTPKSNYFGIWNFKYGN